MPLKSYELFSNTLSSVGYRNQEWFFYFSVSMSAALIFNLGCLLNALKIKTQWVKLAVAFFLFINMALAMAQSLVIDLSVRQQHMVLAIVFTAHSIVTIFLFVGLVIKSNINKKGIRLVDLSFIAFYIAPIFIVGILNLQRVIAVYGFLVNFYQTILVLTGLCVVHLMHAGEMKW